MPRGLIINRSVKRRLIKMDSHALVILSRYELWHVRPAAEDAQSNEAPVFRRKARP